MSRHPGYVTASAERQPQELFTRLALEVPAAQPGACLTAPLSSPLLLLDAPTRVTGAPPRPDRAPLNSEELGLANVLAPYSSSSLAQQP